VFGGIRQPFARLSWTRSAIEQLPLKPLKRREKILPALGGVGLAIGEHLPVYVRNLAHGPFTVAQQDTQRALDRRLGGGLYGVE
jgi:hypothetical protein